MNSKTIEVIVYEKKKLVLSCFQKFKLSLRIPRAVSTLGARYSLIDRSYNADVRREKWR